ncbi:MAG: secretin N-terminal domain-containing protein [Candidatus Rhabdochlamydia sp.]
MNRYPYILMIALFSSVGASDLVIEKKASLLPQENLRHQHFVVLNQELDEVKTALKNLYQRCEDLVKEDASDEEFQQVLREVKLLKKKKEVLEERWHDNAVDQKGFQDDPYSIWDQEDIFLSELLAEYGSCDSLYVIPHELSGIKLHLHSHLPLPRTSWPELIEILLRHHGIGIKPLNRFAKQLYLLKQDMSMVHTVGFNLEHLQKAPDGCRVCYLIAPPLEQMKVITQFLERFCDARQTFIYPVGNKVAVIGTKEDVVRLLDLYDKAWGPHQGKVTKIIPVSKISVKEMEKILKNFFQENAGRGKPLLEKIETEPLGIFPLETSHHLVCIGSKEHVELAQKIIEKSEEQLCDPTETVIDLYPCRHSDPHDLAATLEKIYLSLTQLSATPYQDTEILVSSHTGTSQSTSPALVVNPSPLHSGVHQKMEVERQGSLHFTPDPKTGVILMTVRKDLLDKLKEVIKKLDVPKKMVQIEVLMFERRLHEQNNYGLNLLKLGKERNGVSYIPSVSPYSPKGAAAGLLQFFFQGKEGRHTPQFDVAYNFLLTQDDIHLNASPSVVTVNQTPAIISIVEEISINNGAAPIDTNQGISFEKSFSRANYGIIIKFTPTIHAPEAPGMPGCVTLKTDITFDTTKPHPDDRPLVDRRHIENEVRILDGETVIIGGLKRKSKMDHEEKVSLFGDFPLFGKLFGTTQLIENDTEMFFFITPKIITHPQESGQELMQEELTRRPGDLPEFLQKVDESFDLQKRIFFQKSLKSVIQNDR